MRSTGKIFFTKSRQGAVLPQSSFFPFSSYEVIEKEFRLVKTQKEKAFDEKIQAATTSVAEEAEAPLDDPNDAEGGTEQVSRQQWEELMSQREPMYLPSFETQRRK